VEHGLARRHGEHLGATSPAFLNNTFGNSSHSLESDTLNGSSTWKTLTPYWFASEGFYLDRPCHRAKTCFLELLRQISWHEDLAQLLWRFLPESMFKDSARHVTSAATRNSAKSLWENVYFKPFSVAPIHTSKSWLKVEGINLEVYVCSNVDGVSSSLSLSEINGRFFHWNERKNINFLGDSVSEPAKEEEVRPAKVSQSLSNIVWSTKQFPIPNESPSSHYISKVKSVEVDNNGVECESIQATVCSLRKSLDTSSS